MNNLDFFYTKFSLSNTQKEQYDKYYKLLYEHNKNMNLTGIDDQQGVYLKHFYDSLLLTKFIPQRGSVIGDVGSGAGFPGLVLAIYYPSNTFHLIEPIKKRCNFLNIVINELDLNNVKVLNKRAEELEKDQYEFLLSRAVSSLNILLELCIPLLKNKGYLLAQKGPKAPKEITEAENAFKELNCSLKEIKEEILPFEDSLRYNLVIQKNAKTNIKYPRNYGQIKKRPL